MSDLTPAQRIEAAIVRLEELKAGGTPGPWGGHINILGITRLVDSQRFVLAELYDLDKEGNGYFEASDNLDLIVTLHSTINAQLALLRAAMVEHSDVMTSIEKPYWVAVLALADAIISGGTE